jgi:hypothetical protein
MIKEIQVTAVYTRVLNLVDLVKLHQLVALPAARKFTYVACNANVLIWSEFNRATAIDTT